MNGYVFINVFLFTILSCGAVFLVSDSFMDTIVFPKWTITIICFCFMGILFSLIELFNKDRIKNHEKCFIIYFFIIGIICFVESIYGLYNYWTNNNLYLMGSFDNPAGITSCLTTGLPFLIYFLFSKSVNWYIKIVYFVIISVIFFTVFLSYSRAGLLSLLAVLVILGIYKHIHHNIKRGISWCIFIGGLLVVLWGLYKWKQDSADGRLLIWRCTLDMIKDKPCFGHGRGAFQTKYMLYQANYLKQHPESKYSMLADNIKHPLNEYLLVLVQYGIAGIIVLIFGAICVVKTYLNNKDILSFFALLSLISVAIFACFSYPFVYPFTWIVTIFSFCCIFRKVDLFQILSDFRGFIYGVFILGNIILLKNEICYVKAQYLWKKYFTESLMNITQELPWRYLILAQCLGRDPSFLYNWGMELYVRREWRESIFVLRRCELLSNSSDLQLALGNCYYQLGKYNEAEYCYSLASQMCPKLFQPLYLLVKTYCSKGDFDTARKIAKVIVNKPVKINSISIVRMKKRMSKLLDKDL